MKVVIAAAGTGGHINPGIAIANKVKEMEKNSKITFIGTNRGLENDLVPRAGYTLDTINAYGIERKITIANLKRLYHTFKSITEAKQILQREKPDVVIGTGGYICVPVVLAAKKLNIPIVLHESNAFPGVSTKILAKKVNSVLVGFEDAKERIIKANRVVVTGNPTKINKRNFSNEEINRLKTEMGFKDAEKPVVLVFGGSQGAQSINKSFIDIIKNKKNENYQIMWAAGPAQYDIIKEELNGAGVDVNNTLQLKIVPYIYNMEEIMNAVDLVVCRSGAMTITEISIVGKPAIFIPFPFATENHQEYNARTLEKVGAAKIILDKDLNSEILNNTINEIVSDRKKIAEMSSNANKIAINNVEDRIYEELNIAINSNKKN